MKAMIFGAGLGTRFKPWTDKHPKALAIVNGKTLLERNIAYLQKFGITKVMLNIHHFPEQIRAIIQQNNGWGSTITLSDESAELLETGGGLQKASWYFDEGPFVVINADILTDLDLWDMLQYHQKHKPIATLAVTNRHSSRYFLFNESMELSGWRNTKTGEEKGPVLYYREEEKKKQFQKAFSGIHIIEPDLISLIRQRGKFSIVDTYLDLAKSYPIKGFEHNQSKLIDVGKPEAVAEAEALFP